MRRKILRTSINENEVFSGDFEMIRQIDDLVILEDEESWKDYSMAHKCSAVAASFSFVVDMDGKVIEIGGLQNTPKTSQETYQNNSWYLNSSVKEINADLDEKQIPLRERTTIWEALKTNVPWKHNKWQQQDKKRLQNI